jgi:hypothetical protein
LSQGGADHLDLLMAARDRSLTGADEFDPVNSTRYQNRGALSSAVWRLQRSFAR